MSGVWCEEAPGEGSSSLHCEQGERSEELREANGQDVCACV